MTQNEINMAKQKASEFIENVIKTNREYGCKSNITKVEQAKAEATQAFLRLQKSSSK
jgi:hypothetical protein